MARAIWSGVMSFGLVSVPVELYPATEAHEPTFHQFQKGTADRVRYQRVNERTGDEVGYSETVRGADIGGGDYVILDQDELDAVAPGRSRTLEIRTFVDLDEVDPIYRPLASSPGMVRTSMLANFRKVLADFDADGDGKLSLEEAPILIREQFDRYDTDHDGFITMEDAQRWD
jgi:Ku protein